MRFDEAEKAIRVVLIVTAADPQPEVVVGYGEHPAQYYCGTPGCPWRWSG
jgi:hypothetical protein